MTEDERIEQFTFESFCQFHPHEAYTTWPDKFWEFFHKQFPYVTREQMGRTMKETDEP